MAIHNINASAKQILWGNILLVICCIFYLAWWILAFKPSGAIKGIRTGWLLIPAFITGLAAIALVVKGLQSETIGSTLFPGRYIIWGGIAAYFILLAVTGIFFKRPVTTELLLIDGWTMLALTEINVLYGMGLFPCTRAILFAVVIGAAMVISIVCYMLYYNLGSRAGYIDGMIPLLLVAVIMSGISAMMVFQQLWHNQP